MHAKTSIIAASLLAAALGLSTPATAGQSLSLTLTARTAQEADLLRAGLTLYQIAMDVESGAFVHQDGSLNAAAIAQRANSGSVGVIHQDGTGHQARLDQRGNGQAHGIFQFGHAADADVIQTSHGETGLTFQWGW
jgi:hypothetical protein